MACMVGLVAHIKPNLKVRYVSVQLRPSNWQNKWEYSIFQHRVNAAVP